MPHRKFAFGLLCLVMVLGTALLSAVASVPDGRINVGPYAGGTAIYCVDADNTVSGSYEEGGIKVLSHVGAELLFALGDELAALVAQANANMLAADALVASGPNAFGTGDLMLLVLTNGQFQLSGYDMHGAFFEFRWTGCDPIVPPAEKDPDIAPEPLAQETEEVPV